MPDAHPHDTRHTHPHDTRHTHPHDTRHTHAGRDDRRDDEDAVRAAARHHLRQRQSFRVHAAVAAASTGVIVLVNLMVNLGAGIAGEWWAWWSAHVLLGWGLGVAIHGLAVRAARTRLVDREREDREVDRLLATATGR